MGDLFLSADFNILWNKNTVRQLLSKLPHRSFLLFDDWLQIFKQGIIEKFPNADAQTITYLLDGDHTGIFAFRIQHTVNCRWCYAAQIC